jgi:hypothetical protein
MIVLQIFDLFFVFGHFLVVDDFQLVEFFLQGCLLCDFLHEFESHCFKIFFQELISIVLQKSWAVVIGYQ